MKDYFVEEFKSTIFILIFFLAIIFISIAWTEIKHFLGFKETIPANVDTAIEYEDYMNSQREAPWYVL